MKSENTKLKIIFFGTPYFVVPLHETLIKHFDVVGVVTQPDVVLGRKKILTPTPVKQVFQVYMKKHGKNGLVLNPQQLNNETLEQLLQVQPDLFVVAAYGQIIPKSFLDIPKYGSINIHPSLLPKYRGPSPIQSAILNGDTETGVTFIQMDEEIDHGPILLKKPLAISLTDTFELLHVKLFTLAAELLPTVIQDYISGNLQPQEQEHVNAIFCERIAKKDGYFDLDNPPDKEKLDRMIRAYYPWPTVWTKWQVANGKWQIVKLLPEKRIQLEGGKPMSIKDFFNGYPEQKETINRILNTEY